MKIISKRSWLRYWSDSTLKFFNKIAFKWNMLLLHSLHLFLLIVKLLIRRTILKCRNFRHLIIIFLILLLFIEEWIFQFLIIYWLNIFFELWLISLLWWILVFKLKIWKIFIACCWEFINFLFFCRKWNFLIWSCFIFVHIIILVWN